MCTTAVPIVYYDHHTLFTDKHGLILLLQDTSMSLNEVSAAVSVLLGFAPPTSLPDHSSAQVIGLLVLHIGTS